MFFSLCFKKMENQNKRQKKQNSLLSHANFRWWVCHPVNGYKTNNTGSAMTKLNTSECYSTENYWIFLPPALISPLIKILQMASTVPIFSTNIRIYLLLQIKLLIRKTSSVVLIRLLHASAVWYSVVNRSNANNLQRRSSIITV